MEYSPKTIYRNQFNSKGEKFGSSLVSQDLRDRYKNIKILANDQSVEMSNGLLKIDNKGVSVVDQDKLPCDFEREADNFKIKFKGDKLTPMAKRVLKLFNQAMNK